MVTRTARVVFQNQSGADEQSERERDLANDEPIAGATSGRRVSAAVRSGLQRQLHIGVGRLPGRPQTEQHAAKRRQNKGKAENAKIEVDFVKPRNALRTPGHERVTHPDRAKNSKHSSEHCDKKTFKEKLTNNLAATGANSRADGKFSRARRPASGEQVSQIRAGDQQHHSNGAKKEDQIRSIFPDQILQERLNDNANVFV